jgi:alpha-1,2-mannosyltransferase
VPLVLVATGRWKAFFAATFTATTLAAISFVMFGAQTWRAFFNSLGFIRHFIIERGEVQFYTMQTVFAATRLMGGSIAAGYVSQIVAVTVAAATIVWIWRQNVQFELKAAALATAIVLVSPYIIYYDLVVLALPIAWLALEGRRSRYLPFEKSLLMVAWMLPLVCEPLARLTSVPLTPLVCFLLLGFIMRRVRVAMMIPAAPMIRSAASD